MKLTFKQFIQEDGTSQALDVAAKMINVDKSKLVVVGDKEQNDVLEMGRELKKQFIKMVHGNLIVRLFKALGDKLFARVEFPDGEMKMYKAAGVNESITDGKRLRTVFSSDLDSEQRKTLKAIESKLGKTIDAVSQSQVLDALKQVAKDGKIGGDENRYKEFVADLKRAFAGSVRTSQF